MNPFDARARDWDNNPLHWERSEVIASEMLKRIPVSPHFTALEFGAGTGILKHQEPASEGGLPKCFRNTVLK